MSDATNTPATPATLAHAWATWLAYRSCGARPLRDSTLADYESIWRCHLCPHLGELSLAEIDGTAIAGLVVALNSAGVKPKRVANVLVPLRACLRWHHRMGTFGRDPTPWFDAAPPPAEERRILTIAQIEALAAALPPHYRALVTFAAYTGVRLGELRALTWDDIDLERRTARIDKTLYRDRLQRSTKTGHDRTVPIPPHVADELAEWREHCPPPPAGGPAYVFPATTGGPLDADTFRARVWRKAVRAAGLPAGLRIHDGRVPSSGVNRLLA
jgi:integrase